MLSPRSDIIPLGTVRRDALVWGQNSLVNLTSNHRVLALKPDTPGVMSLLGDIITLGMAHLVLPEVHRDICWRRDFPPPQGQARIGKRWQFSAPNWELATLAPIHVKDLLEGSLLNVTEFLTTGTGTKVV